MDFGNFEVPEFSRKNDLPTCERTDKPPARPKGQPGYGALAQLVEHLHGMQGVSGSNPLRSTSFHQQFFCLRILAAKVVTFFGTR